MPELEKELDQEWEDTKKKSKFFFFIFGLLLILASGLFFEAGRQQVIEAKASQDRMNMELQEMLRAQARELSLVRHVAAMQRRVIAEQDRRLWEMSIVVEYDEARLVELEDRHGDDLRTIDLQSGVISTLDRACRAQ